MLPPEDGAKDRAEEPKGSAADPENPTADGAGASAKSAAGAAAAADASFEEKEAAARRDFLRNMFMVLAAQWSAVTFAIICFTYWMGLRRFVQHYVQGFEMTFIVPSLVSSVILLLFFKTDTTKNVYVFGAFTGAFVASVSVACTYMPDDHWLLMGFLIVTAYIHVFAMAQIPSAWKGTVNAVLPNLPYSFHTAAALSLVVTAVLTFLVCAVFKWWHWLAPAAAFSGAVIVYGMLDTYLLWRNLSPDEWLIGVICLYTDPFNLILSLCAMAVSFGAECANQRDKPQASNAFD